MSSYWQNPPMLGEQPKPKPLQPFPSQFRPLTPTPPQGGFRPPEPPSPFEPPEPPEPFEAYKPPTVGGPPQPPSPYRPLTPPTVPGGVRPIKPYTPTAIKPINTPRPQLPSIVPETDPNGPGGNLRSSVYTPGNDPRLRGAQDRTDAAIGNVMTRNRGAMQQGEESRYRSVFGTGGVNAGNYTVDPNVQFRGINTQVNAGAVNPNVEGDFFVDPTVNFRNVGTQATAGRVDPNVANRSVNTQVQKGPGVDAAESARTSRYGSAQDAALEGLGGPSRTELARQALADFDAQGEVGLQNRFRRVGQTASKFGRTGLGDVNAELGSIQGDYERDRLTKQNELARSVAEGDISDRFRRVDATSGLRGQEAGIDAGMRGEGRIERDYDTGLDERNVSRGLDDRDYQTGLGERNVTRAQSERDTQLGVTERNLARGSEERDLETALNERNLGRSQANQNTRMGLVERNVGRQFDERGFKAGLDADNIGRAGQERDLETALNERNVDRRMGERDVGLGIETGNQDRSFARNRASIDAATRYTDSTINDDFDKLGAAGSLEDRIYGQGQGARGEFRTERGYQQGTAQQTIENRIRERQLQQDEEETRLRRAALQAQAGGSL